MPSRKQSNNQDIRHMDTRKISRFGKVVLSVIATILLGIVVTLVWLRIGTNSVGISELTANVTPPSPSTFTDDNTMIFTNNGNVPDVNNARELSAPGDVVISYNLESGPYQPTFKINLTDKELSENIKITPVIRGKWHLRGDSMIVFTPESNWPADKKFTIKINPAGGQALANGETTWVEVEVTSTSPYEKTLSGRLIVGVGTEDISYEIMDSENSPYLEVNITNSLDVGKDVKLSFDPNIILLDMTSSYYLNSSATTTTQINGYSYVNSVTSFVDTLQTTTVRFYKIDPTQNYTHEAGSTEPPVITLTY